MTQMKPPPKNPGRFSAAWGREDSVETTTNVYEIPNETSFTVTYEGGSTNTARYCAQVPD